MCRRGRPEARPLRKGSSGKVALYAHGVALTGDAVLAHLHEDFAQVINAFRLGLGFHFGRAPHVDAVISHGDGARPGIAVDCFAQRIRQIALFCGIVHHRELKYIMVSVAFKAFDHFKFGKLQNTDPAFHSFSIHGCQHHVGRVRMQNGSRIAHFERREEQRRAFGEFQGLIARRPYYAAREIELENIVRLDLFFLHAAWRHEDSAAPADRDTASGAAHPAQGVEVPTEFADDILRRFLDSLDGVDRICRIAKSNGHRLKLDERLQASEVFFRFQTEMAIDRGGAPSLPIRMITLARRFLFASVMLLAVLSTSCGEKAPAGKEMYVSARSGLVVRKTPDAKGERIGLIAHGGKVVVVGQEGGDVTIAGKTGKWSKIKFKGQDAFVFGGFLNETKPEALPAAPQGPDTSIATVVSLENADTACNVEMDFEGGGREIWPADFEICQKLKPGQRFRFKTRKEKVMAASCQGDPQCTQSDEVELIVSVQIVK